MSRVAKLIGLPLVLAAMIFAGTPAAEAQVQAPQPPPPAPQLFPVRAWTLTPFLGIGFGGNLETTPLTGGVAFGYVGSGLGIEGEIARLRGEQGVLARFQTSVWTLALNGTYDFDTEYAFTPYATVGIMWQRASADLTDIPGAPFEDDTTSGASWNFGGGIKTALTEQAGLRIDLRYMNGHELAPDFWRLYAGFTWRFLPAEP